MPNILSKGIKKKLKPLSIINFKLSRWYLFQGYVNQFFYQLDMFKTSNQVKNNKSIISMIKTIGAVMLTGLSIGVLMSIVSNAFVLGVEFLFNSRNHLN